MTQELLEQNTQFRDEDLASATNTKIETLEAKRDELKSKDREMGRGALGGLFKIAGQGFQGMIAGMRSQKKQKSMQVVVAVAQMASGLVSMFANRANRTRLDEAIDSVDETIARLQNPPQSATHEQNAEQDAPSTPLRETVALKAAGAPLAATA